MWTLSFSWFALTTICIYNYVFIYNIIYTYILVIYIYVYFQFAVIQGRNTRNTSHSSSKKFFHVGDARLRCQSFTLGGPKTQSTFKNAWVDWAITAATCGSRSSENYIPVIPPSYFGDSCPKTLNIWQWYITYTIKSSRRHKKISFRNVGWNQRWVCQHINHYQSMGCNKCNRL